jgi:thiol-disulfide isomerase/thioredoxin
MKIKIILSYASLGFILFLFYLGLSSNPQYETKNLVGKKIVSFELESLLGDNKINNEDLKKNNYTLINFWASWCGPCRLESTFKNSWSQF